MKQSIFCLFLFLLGILKQTVRLHMHPPSSKPHLPVLLSLSSPTCLIHWLSFALLHNLTPSMSTIPTIPWSSLISCPSTSSFHFSLREPSRRWFCKWSAGCSLLGMKVEYRLWYRDGGQRGVEMRILGKGGRQEREGYGLVHSPRQWSVKFQLPLPAFGFTSMLI